MSTALRRLVVVVPVLATLLGSCSGESTGPSLPQVRALTVSPNPATLRVDETLVMVALLSADSTADHGITWRTADPRKVSVTETGILKGIGVGSAVVTATSIANPDVVATIPVTVLPAYSGVFRISASPQSLTLIPGQTQGLSATIDADSRVSRNVRFTSDNLAVATVSTTGLVTAITVGSARITARSVADTNVSTIVSVTVRPATATRVSLQTLTSRGTGNPIDLQNVVGQVDALLNVEQGEGLLERVDLVVRNNNRDTVVASQSFTAAQAALIASASRLRASAAGSSSTAAASTSSTIVLSFRTDAFDTTTGQAAFRNGATSIKAVAVSSTAGASNQEASSSVVAYLNNVDGFLVSARGLSSTGIASALDPFGRRWMQAGRGLVITTSPVSYSGRPIGSRTISFPGASPTAAVTSTKTGVAVDTLLLPAGFATATTGDGYLLGELPSIVAVDSTGNALDLVPAAVSALGRGGAGILNAQSGFQNGTKLDGLRVDNAPPPALSLVISSVKQNSNNWINGAYSFASGISGILPDAGVGLPGPTSGITPASAAVGVYATGGTLSDTTLVTTGADLPASSTNTTYTVFARYADRLGNERIVPLAGTTVHPRTTIGVDLLAPTIRYASGSLVGETLVSTNADSVFASATGALGPRAFAIDAIDDRSGLPSDGVAVAITRLAQPNPSGAFTGTMSCIVGTGSACAPATATFESTLPDQYRQYTTTMDGGTGIEGYYTFTATVRDQAGNVSNVSTKRALLDAGTTISAPTLTGLGVSGVLDGGQPAAFIALALDNVELARGGLLVGYPNLPGASQMLTYATPLSGGTSLGVAFDASLTSPIAGTHAAFTFPGFIRGLEIVDATDAPQAYPAASAKPTSANAWVTDFAAGGAPATLSSNVAIAAGSVQSASGTPGFLALAGSPNELQRWRRVAGPGSLRFEAIGPSGQTNAPFARVILARLDPTGLSVNANAWRVLTELTTPVGADNGVQRSWTYDFGSQPSGSYVAIGITAAGDAIATQLVAF